MKLANGLEIDCISAAEARVIYREIFEQLIYAGHGIALSPDACVLDAGANIGLFSLFVLQQCPQARLYAFEPIPVTFAVLERNLKRHRPAGAQVEAFNAGLSDRRGTGQFTYFPRMPGNSTLHLADKDQAKALMKQTAAQGVKREVKWLHYLTFLIYPFRARLYHWLIELLHRHDSGITCQLETISHIIAEKRIERIDLLKVDVEGAELDVLLGIADADWLRIRQVVLEVQDKDGRLQKVCDLLEAHGFATQVEQDERLRVVNISQVYATRAPLA